MSRTAAVLLLTVALSCAACTVAPAPVDSGMARCTTPDRQTCADGIATVCGRDGVLRRAECDPMQGATCDPDGCHGECAPFASAPSYQGCDYYPTVTMNPVWSQFTFAVAVASTSTEDTTILITRGNDTLASITLAPGALEIVPLPWVRELKGDDFVGASTNVPPAGPTQVVTDGAYRLRANHPVTVYQLSPLEYTLGPISDSCPGAGWGTCNSYSNDAALLLPTNALGTSYALAAWPSGGGGPSIVAITATEDDTSVVLSGAHGIRPGGGVDANGGGVVVLDRGDVLQIVADPVIEPTTFGGAFRYGGDLTGAHLDASARVQVIGGNSCANVPSPVTGYCDHIEEVLFPTGALGTEYVVGSPAPPTGADSRAYVLRVVRADHDAMVHFEPPLLPDTLLTEAMPFIEIRETESDVHITSDQRVLVSQYMEGSSSLSTMGDPRASGDPSQSTAVPVRQFRRDYLFFSSSTYDQSYAMVIAPAGASVTVDGAVIPAGSFRDAGGAFQIADVPLTGEVHHASATVQFGIVVYGYGVATSYMYPGGLDLIDDLI